MAKHGPRSSGGRCGHSGRHLTASRGLSQCRAPESACGACSWDDYTVSRSCRRWPAAGRLPGTAEAGADEDNSPTRPPLPLTGTAGTLVIRAPLITIALREYFKMLWDRANVTWPPVSLTSADRHPF